MAQAVRERREELGVLKALGFTNLQVLVLVLVESCLLAGVAGFVGLAIAKSVISLHGGSISACSAGPGKGACFTVLLPGAVQSSSATDSHPEDGGPTSSNGEILMRLLVVEDHDPTLQVLCRLLTRAGHSVVGVGTKAEAIAQAGEAEFDAVLSGLGLPDGTGHELMKLLHERHGLRGIAFSGFGTELDMQTSLKSGFVAHLIKPAQFSEIQRALSMIGECRQA